MSFFDISLETANRFYTFGWASSLSGAAITLLGVGSLMWGTSVRDRDTESQLSTSKERTATLEVRAEELRNANLLLEKQLVDLKKSVRGREISDEQHDRIIAALKGTRLPDFTTYVVRDFEAQLYAFSIISVLQEIGMPCHLVFLEDPAPLQPGVMACGDGTDESTQFIKVLMDAGIVGVGNPSGKFGDKTLPYCPPFSIFVGRRVPIQEMRPLPKK